MSTVTRAEFRPANVGVQYEFDGNTAETVASAAPFQFGDEFVGAGHTAGVPAAGSPAAGYPWVKKIVGAAPPTVALVNNSSGGVIACTLAANSEAEEAGLYFNDSLCVDTSKLGQAEWRSALNVTPTGVAMAAIGLGSAWVGGPLNLSVYLLFVWNAGNALTVQWQDNNGDSGSLPATPLGGSAISTDSNYHIYRIDWSNSADIAFYVDGARVNPVGSVTWNPTAPILQPWHDVYKSAGTGLGQLFIDKIDVFNGR